MSFDSKTFLKSLTQKPGVYRMYDKDEGLLYVGKAKNLKNRVSSYFSSSGLTNKTVALVSKIHGIEISITGSETEALLLEQNLIKQNKPPYNILLKDDKSYPYIYRSSHEYPLITHVRGKKFKQGEYFGPFPSSLAVKESLNFLQKVFRLRNCEDSYFNNRSRPCLQHQIGRCTAPCVGLISKEEYLADILHAQMFLQGKNNDLLVNLNHEMELLSNNLKFEEAARIRDQIQYLRKVQESQSIDAQQGDADIIAIDMQKGVSAVHVASVRHGRMLGSRSYYPKFQMDESHEQALAAFISQFYFILNKEIPDEVIVSHEMADQSLIRTALSEKKDKKIKLSVNVRAERSRWLQLAIANAQEAVRVKQQDKLHILTQYQDLKEVLSLAEMPVRMECFDISHSHGEATVASCVVFNQEGALKNDYRKFNIEGIEPGDDYGAMKQALTRRFKKLSHDKKPDILLVDGGKGQLNIALNVLSDLSINDIPVLGVSKGVTRKAGMEILIFQGKEFTLNLNSPALHLIQQIRDESHRFAIVGHRARRAKARGRSILEGIAGIGPKRRKELIRFFGDAGQVKAANVDEISKVPGISRQLAQQIYDALHGS
ncbi:excinuclease ABC subunit UvrC [Oceaniserpentilla sp. 4NH20-0058]|uniref:excinuclease ABC subunit UvrC n=1 Tax=Oceaniserpentilla sp. 4NH20-0058 TaxID=3127660 RepID=UPI0031020867